MDDDLLADLGADQLPAAEFALILQTHFGGASQVGTDFDTIYYPNEHAPALTLQYRDNVLLSVEGGSALTDDDTTAIRERVLEEASPAPTFVKRAVMFTPVPTEGWWRYRDQLQIVPPPEQAPLPEAMIADHPFVVEFSLKQSANSMIKTAREWRAEQEIAYLLNALVGYRVNPADSRRHQHSWVAVPDAGEIRVVYTHDFYFIPGYDLRPAVFTDTSGMAPLEELPPLDQYTRSGIRADDRFSVPCTLADSLDQFHALDGQMRERFLRSAYWFSFGRRVWHLSASATFTAWVQAIEALIPDESGPECKECGKPIGPGPTRLFADFVETYFPELTKKQRDQLYKVRSSIVHRGHLLRIDDPGVGFTGLDPEDLRDLDRHRNLRGALQLGLVGWLASHAVV